MDNLGQVFVKSGGLTVDIKGVDSQRLDGMLLKEGKGFTLAKGRLLDSLCFILIVKDVSKREYVNVPEVLFFAGNHRFRDIFLIYSGGEDVLVFRRDGP